MSSQAAGGALILKMQPESAEQAEPLRAGLAVPMGTSAPQGATGESARARHPHGPVMPMTAREPSACLASTCQSSWAQRMRCCWTATKRTSSSVTVAVRGTRRRTVSITDNAVRTFSLLLLTLLTYLLLNF